ncbi:MAG TPA: amidase [Stellaceae bacterium]|nr:amidase [Stellaceae bacterium]
MDETTLCQLGAAEAAGLIGRRELSSEELVAACLTRIGVREPTVHAWAFVDPEAALRQAKDRDQDQRRGPLHGVPIGLKDVIDTADMPTRHGSAVFADRQPTADAEAVARLREAGAVILGKCVTTEFATYHPGPTANPLAPTHTPGGSSSGSAAAVADFHVPVAFGTQTAGSVIRPASFCGVFGFKPSFGRYPTAGVLRTSEHLDTLGLFARSIEDFLLLDAVLAPEAREAAEALPPVVGICRSPAWEAATEPMRAALAAVAVSLERVGVTVVERELPPEFDRLIEAQTIIHMRETFMELGDVRVRRPEAVSDAFKRLVDDGAAIAEPAYREALRRQRLCRELSETVFREVGLLLTPAAPGPAPVGLAATGNPVFNRLWTAFGTPCLGFPGGMDSSGLPLGLQFVGPPGRDRACLKAAHDHLRRLGIALPRRFPESATPLPR